LLVLATLISAPEYAYAFFLRAFSIYDALLFCATSHSEELLHLLANTLVLAIEPTITSSIIMFGATKPNNLFGPPQQANNQGGAGLFGGQGNTNQQTASNLFGGSAATNNQQGQQQQTGLGLFGQSQNQQQNQPQQQQQTNSIFGSSLPQPVVPAINNYQQQQPQQTQQGAGLFGLGLNNQQNNQQQGSGLFNNSTNTQRPLFQNSTQQNPLAQSQLGQLGSSWQINSALNPRRSMKAYSASSLTSRR
jgi:hypothetical protein